MNRFLRINLSDDEYKKISEAAQAAGLDIEAHLRRELLGVDPPQPPEPKAKRHDESPVELAGPADEEGSSEAARGRGNRRGSDD